MANEAEIQNQQGLIRSFFEELQTVVVGQRYLAERILTGLLAGGHILIEGLPGLAKTLTVKTFAQLIDLKFSRIQFTPDMLPADLTGAPVFDQKTGNFNIKKGPIFTHILLADEINRAPAKVQSALLEIMQEKQVTIGEESFAIAEPFLVLATQNFIEQEGTYALPESQLDRFMFKVRVHFPSREEESVIIRRMAATDVQFNVKTVLTPEKILNLRRMVNEVELAPNVEHYILDVIEATREPARFGLTELSDVIVFGVSPRATLHLTLAAKAYALIQGRHYVRPGDVKSLAPDVLSHRIIETTRASGIEHNPYTTIRRILERIEMPK